MRDVRWFPRIVLIQECYEGPFGFSDTPVTSRTLARILLLHNRDEFAGVHAVIHESSTNSQRLVARTIVNDNDFKRRLSLLQHALYCFDYVGRPVVKSDNAGYIGITRFNGHNYYSSIFKPEGERRSFNLRAR
jgi:hypothetical protein